MNEVATYYENYTAVGDILVMATVIVFAILLRTAYVNRGREIRLIGGVLVLLFSAAAIDIFFNIFVSNPAVYPHILIYFLRAFKHIFLFSSLFLYVLYMKDPLHMNEELDVKYIVISATVLIMMIMHEIGGVFLKYGFYIDENNVVHTGFNIFAIVYVFFVSLLIIMLLRYKDKIYRPVLYGIISSCGVSFIVMFIQGLYNQSSFTIATFLFPTYAVLYYLHANPLDIVMGSSNEDEFETYITETHAQKKKLLIAGLYMREFDFPGTKMPKELRNKMRDYNTLYFKGGKIFQISGGRLLFCSEIKEGDDYEKAGNWIINYVREQREIYKQDFKLVITKTDDNLSERNDYISFIQYIENRMPENDARLITEKEIQGYYDHRYIVDELADINEKKDLHDSRVIVFCQPVYNVTTGKFDTAEALMRLKLEKTGMVFPDKFIPIAEAHNYIHMLSMIILAKTCEQIRKLMEDGYYVKRISVNFSMIDIREEHFAFNVKQIIEDAGIEYDKIAIEITESQNESDFMMVRDRIFEMRKNGIIFYLDDFGTGYSNFERIMELPFDIVKFDRSLVIASGSDVKAETMVSYLAHMFTDMNYSVLYEGIENEEDEMRCTRMFARYLQGYKYSKPIPIENLTEFFEKVHDY
jgi:EAL domain-containing protein (putative c-di-GMP-specific phosphodiesterase class I)